MFEKQQRTTSFRPALRLRLARRLARMTAVLTLTTWVGGSPAFAIEGDSIRCVLRLSPVAGDAPRPLGRSLNSRLDLKAKVMFAIAHEVDWLEALSTRRKVKQSDRALTGGGQK
jgi:hypothetical protein